MSKETRELGDSLIRLGRTIKNGKGSDIDPELMSLLTALTPHLPKLQISTAWNEQKDPLGGLILTWIREGQTIPTGSECKDITNALTRLRRNGFIVNRGNGPGHPKWELTTEEEREQIIDELRIKRSTKEKAK